MVRPDRDRGGLRLQLGLYPTERDRIRVDKPLLPGPPLLQGGGEGEKAGAACVPSPPFGGKGQGEVGFLAAVMR